MLLAVMGCNKSNEQVSPRNETLLENGWKFSRADTNASDVDFDDSHWQQVTVPHDWAIKFIPEFFNTGFSIRQEQNAT